MRVALLSITGGGMSGGYAKYLDRMVPLMAADRRVSAMLLVTLAGTKLTGAADGIERREVASFYRGPTRWPSAELGRALAEFRPDVLFVPNFRLLMGVPWPLVVLVHNMYALAWDDRADPIRQRLVNLARRVEGRLAAGRARRVIAVSRFVEEFLVGRWGLSRAKVGTVYHGADDAVLPGQERRPRALPADVGAGFLFTAGATRPSRGLEDVIAALRYLGPAAPPLVVAGMPDRYFIDYERRLREGSADLSGGGRVIWTDQLDQREMAWCYRNASAFVMTSRVEACPNIALESLSYGCVCVSSESPPLPEIYSSAARFYRAADPASCADELRRVAAWSAEETRTAREAALARSRSFTWSGTADRTLTELASAIG